MAKVRLDPNQLPPMPVALVGTLVEGRVNFMAAAWITRVTIKPPRIGVGINHRQWTHGRIQESGAFSLCFPGPELVEKTNLLLNENILKQNKSHFLSQNLQTIHLRWLPRFV